MNKNLSNILDFSNKELILNKLLEICRSLSTIDIQPIYAELSTINLLDNHEDILKVFTESSEKLSKMLQPTAGRQQLVTDFVTLVEKFKTANDSKLDNIKKSTKLIDEVIIPLANSKKSEDNVQQKTIMNEESTENSDKKQENKSIEKEKDENLGDGSEVENEQVKEKIDEAVNEGSGLTENEAKNEVIVAEALGTKTKLTKTAIKKLPAELVERLGLVVGDFIYYGIDQNILHFQKAGSDEIVKIEK